MASRKLTNSGPSTLRGACHITRLMTNPQPNSLALPSGLSAEELLAAAGRTKAEGVVPWES